MKQTAVEWYAEQGMKLEISRLKGEISTEKMLDLLFEKLRQAKEMEKEQIKRLLEIIMWYDEESDVRPDIETYTWFMQLYNETFKSE